jgi:hypothetical protein
MVSLKVGCNFLSLKSKKDALGFISGLHIPMLELFLKLLRYFCQTSVVATTA